MTDQAQAVEGDVQARMEAYLEAEETLSPEDDENELVAAETVEDTEEVITEEETEEVEEPTETITWNGEEKVVTKSELKTLAQQGFDYTQKTQAIAEERRSLQAQTQQFQATLAIQSQLADVLAEVKAFDKQLAQYKDVDWGQLIDQDPVQAMKLNQVYRDMKDARETKVREYNQQAQYLSQVQQQSREQTLQAEMKLLAQRVPEFAGEKAAEAQGAIANYLHSEGFSDVEVKSIIDHRMVAVAWKAAQYDKLKAAKPEINKRVAEAPRVVKPKQSTNANVQANNDLKAKLKKTGRDEYATKLIEGMI